MCQEKTGEVGDRENPSDPCRRILTSLFQTVNFCTLFSLARTKIRKGEGPDGLSGMQSCAKRVGRSFKYLIATYFAGEPEEHSLFIKKVPQRPQLQVKVLRLETKGRRQLVDFGFQ